MSKWNPLAERSPASLKWPASRRTRMLLILLLVLVGGYVAVELIALSGNLNDLPLDRDRDLDMDLDDG